MALGTFYVYFPGKLDIFRELVLGLSQMLRRETGEATRRARDRIEAERLGFEAFFRFVQRHKNLYRIVREAEFVDPPLYRAYYETMARGYARRLQRAQEAGEIGPGDAETFAYCLMGMGDYLGMRWVLWEGSDPPEAVVDSLMTLVSRGLQPEGGNASAPRSPGLRSPGRQPARPRPRAKSKHQEEDGEDAEG